MARRSDHTREELQRLIVDAASDLVAERGADGVTARLIAKRIGYAPGTLYTQFENLTDIFLHVNGESLQALYDLCEAALADDRSPRDALVAMGYAYLQFALDRPHHFRLMFTQHLPPGVPVADWLQARIDALFALVERQFARLMPGVDDATKTLSAHALWAAVHGTASLSTSDQLFTQRWQADREMIRSVVENYVDGWAARRHIGS